MKISLVLAVALALHALPQEARAQCPFAPSFVPYGTSCPAPPPPPFPPSPPYSTLGAALDSATCSLTFTLTTNPYLTFYVTSQWLVLGLSSASVPAFPWPCPLLVYPDFVFSLPTPPFWFGGTASMTIPLPPAPALVGLEVFAQGFVERPMTFPGAGLFFDQTAGLKTTL